LSLFSFRINLILARKAAQDALLIGRVKVLYNGNDHTANCILRIKTSNDMTVELSLARSDVAAMRTAAASIHFDSISCVDSASTYNYYFSEQPMQLARLPQINYFGDISFDWRTAGGPKIGAAFMFGIAGHLADQATSDGELFWVIRDGTDSIKSVVASALKDIASPEIKSNWAKLKK